MSSERVERLVAEMTLEEKVSLLAGEDMWHTPAVERLGIPRFRMTDGPNGARGTQQSGGPPSACFPCGTALAATWDTELISRVGVELGREVKAKGAQLLLGPTVNIHRSPLAGRNFECYSEDPHLAARIAVAYINGVNSQGVGTAVKHFVGNDSEFERHTISSEIPERALREIYLVPFEAAITEAGSWSIMSAYNRVDGTFCSEHARLLTSILRDEWGFDGFVVSDWWGTKSTVAATNAGLDVEMPGPPVYRGERLLAAVREGDVDEKTIDDRVRALLGVVERSGILDDKPDGTERAEDSADRRALLRETAAASIVLLRNEPVEGRALLPLSSDVPSVAVIGPNAAVAQIQGGGSAGVTPHRAISPLEGITERLGSARVTHERGASIARSFPRIPPSVLARRDGSPGLDVAYFSSDEPAGDAVLQQVAHRAQFVWTGRFAPELDPRSWSAEITTSYRGEDTGVHTFQVRARGRARMWVDDVLVVDAWGAADDPRGHRVSGDVVLSEGARRDIRIHFAPSPEHARAGLEVRCQPPVPTDLFERAVAAAAAADVAILVVGMDNEWESEGYDRLNMDLPGRQDELVRAVAAANPRTVVVVNTGSPVTMDWAEEVPAIVQAWYAGEELGNAIADVLFGDVNPSGRLPTTFPMRLVDTPAYVNYPGEFGEVRYGEGIFVGYRYYDTKQVAPRYAFGHGLSYTRFEYANARASKRAVGRGEPLTITVDVTNAGSQPGAEVVQLYVRDVESSVARPDKELRGFTKVHLDPGETRSVELVLDERALAFWDPAESAWRSEPGTFEALVGSSSRDIRASVTFDLAD